jgi:hypothetical protein
MANSNPTDSSRVEPRFSLDEDHIVESGILGFVIEEHPHHMTIPELSLAINCGRGGFSERDAVERGIRELVGAGLLHICGGLVLPTRAALYCAGLEMSL